MNIISGYDIIGEEVIKYRDSLKICYDSFIIRISADGEEFNDFADFDYDGTLTFLHDWDEGQDEFKLIRIIPLHELWEEQTNTAEWNIVGKTTLHYECSKCCGAGDKWDKFCKHCGRKMTNAE